MKNPLKQWIVWLTILNTMSLFLIGMQNNTNEIIFWGSALIGGFIVASSFIINNKY